MPNSAHIFTMKNTMEAYQFAHFCHKNQVRKYSGKPYIDHPARVASLIQTNVMFNKTMIDAAWLHDVMEDCNISHDNLWNYFGLDVADLVESLTNPSKKYPTLNRQKRKEIDREHIRNGSYSTQTIKLFDRYDNITEMLQDVQIGNIKSDFPKIYAQETLLLIEVFMQDIKEDFSKYIYYTEIAAKHFLKENKNENSITS